MEAFAAAATARDVACAHLSLQGRRRVLADLCGLTAASPLVGERGKLLSLVVEFVGPANKGMSEGPLAAIVVGDDRTTMAAGAVGGEARPAPLEAVSPGDPTHAKGKVATPPRPLPAPEPVPDGAPPDPVPDAPDAVEEAAPARPPAAEAEEAGSAAAMDVDDEQHGAGGDAGQASAENGGDYPDDADGDDDEADAEASGADSSHMNGGGSAGGGLGEESGTDSGYDEPPRPPEPPAAGQSESRGAASTDPPSSAAEAEAAAERRDGGESRGTSPVRLRFNVKDLPDEENPPAGADEVAAEAEAAVSAAKAAVEAMRAAQGASAASAAPWRTSSSALPPPPTPQPTQALPCLRGNLRPSGGGGWICEGLWGMSKEAHEPGQPEHTVSPFVYSCAPPPPSLGRLNAAAAKMDVFPYSGKYQGRVSIYQGASKGHNQINEKDLQLSFHKNSAGYYNVEGSGSNRIGSFAISGTLQNDGSLEIFKRYLPKATHGVSGLVSPRGTSHPALKRGRSEGGSFARSQSSRASAGKSLSRASSSTAANGDAEWGASLSDGASPPLRDHTRRISRVPSHLKEAISNAAAVPVAPVESLRKCGRLLQSLMNVKNKSTWFNTPVDPVALKIPDYLRIIKRPMDLGTIKTKMDNSQYVSVDDFAEDVRLVFNNAIAYNTNPMNLVNVAARELLSMFEDRLLSIRSASFEHGALKRKKSSGGGGGGFSSDGYSDDDAPPPKRKSGGGVGGGGGGGGGIKRQRSSPGGPRPRPAAVADSYGVQPGTVTLPVSQLEEMQRRMEDMQRRMIEMENRTGIGAGAASGTGGQAEPPPPEPEEPAEPAVPLTFDEKRQLSEDINELLVEPEKLARVVAIIQEHMPLGSTALDEEVEIDLDSMDTPLLRALQDYISECRKNARKGAKRRGGGGGAGAAWDGSDSSDDGF